MCANLKHTPGQNQRMRRNHEPCAKPHRRVLHPRYHRRYVVGIAMNDPRTKEQAMIDEAVVGLRNVAMTIRQICISMPADTLYGDLPAMQADMAMLKECIDAIAHLKQHDMKLAGDYRPTAWTANMEVGDEVHQ